MIPTTNNTVSIPVEYGTFVHVQDVELVQVCDSLEPWAVLHFQIMQLQNYGSLGPRTMRIRLPLAEGEALYDKLRKALGR